MAIGCQLVSDKSQIVQGSVADQSLFNVSFQSVVNQSLTVNIH